MGYSNIYHYCGIVVKRRRTLYIVCGVITICSLVMLLLTPNKYEAITSIMPPIEENTDILTGSIGGLKSLTSGVAGLGKISSLPGMSTPSDVFGAILASRTIQEVVIQRCDLISFYKLSKTAKKKPAKAMELAVRNLQKSTKVEIGLEGIIVISVKSKKAKKSAEIANAYIDALDEYNRVSSMTRSRKTREFIGGRLLEEKGLLAEAEDSLRSFQYMNKTISMPEEMKAVIEAIAAIESQIASEEVKRDVLLSYSTTENSQVNITQIKIDKLRNQLKKLEQGGTPFVALKKAPTIALELARLMRNVKIREEVVLLLTQQFEQAKINEIRDTPTLQVLDRAIPPQRKISPKRLTLLLLSLFIGLSFGVIASIIEEQVELIKQSPERYHKYLSLIQPWYADLQAIRQRLSRSKQR